MHWSQMALALAVPLASLSDALMQFGMVLLLLAVSVAGVIIWLTLRQWGPALRQLSTIVDREMREAEHSAEGLQHNAQAQMKRVYRQAASVRGALDGVKSLHSLTVDIEQRAQDLRQLAHHMAAESSAHGIASDDFARYAITSADHLAETAERAKHTYRKLLTSVNQLVTDGDSLREGEEMERQARELTGAVERVRLAVHDRRALAPNAAPKPHGPRGGKAQPDVGKRSSPGDHGPERVASRNLGEPAENFATRDDDERQRDSRRDRGDGRDAPFDPLDRAARGRRPESAIPDAHSQPGTGRVTRSRNPPRDAYGGSLPAPEREWDDRERPRARPTHARDRDAEFPQDDDRLDEGRRRRPTHRRPFVDDERDWQR